MRTMLNTLNPTYKLPYGCGTVAIANALAWKNLPADLGSIQYKLEESNFTSYSSKITKTLEKLKIDFQYQDEVRIEDCLRALDGKQGVIMLSWGKDEVGHYSFFYRNKYDQMLENDKLSAPALFKTLANKRSVKSNKKAIAWIIK
jgi:hypothetical protein